MPASKAKTILVVEDDEPIRSAIEFILREEGYHVLCAGNGLEALAMLKRTGPADLILLDLMMPVMNGEEFLRAQRGDPALGGIPVVVCSAVATTQAKPPLADAFVRKPLQLDHLLQVVERFAS